MTASSAVGTPPSSAAHVIGDEAEAVSRAAELAERFASDAGDRDAQRRIPYPELDAVSASGLLGITVPREHGGAEVGTRALVEVFRLLATGDPNIAQIPQSHFVYLNVLRENGDEDQRRFFHSEVLSGARFGNAQAEAAGKNAQQVLTRLTATGDGDYVLEGRKKYATGALLAHWITVLAVDDRGQQVVAYVPRHDPGVGVDDDWGGMGQRTTASGTVRLERVSVPSARVVPHHLTFTRPQVHGSLAQILHAAIDVGIARNALEDAAEFVRTRSRAWDESGVEQASDDPLTIQRFGELGTRVRAAETLLDTAAGAIDVARADLTDDTAGKASIEVATAKAFAGEAAVEVGNALFEVSGTRSSADETNLHRHWRNARTHTLHDPVRWKIQHIGRYVLNATLPPRNGQI